MRQPLRYLLALCIVLNLAGVPIYYLFKAGVGKVKATQK